MLEFRSFSAMAAAEAGCTSFSFCVLCGVFLPGGADERWLKRDGEGRALPNEAYCTYRALLKKRGPIDGFDGMDIFFIDPDGHTTAAVFQEVRYLLTEVAPRWYSGYDHLDRLMGWLDGTIPIPDANGPGLMQFQGPRVASGYLLGEALLARLRRANGETGTVELERAAGHALNFPPVLGSAWNAEEVLLHLWPEWKAPVPSALPALGEARPKLKDLAGIVSLRKGREVLVTVPTVKSLRKRANLPENSFYVGLGLYWPELEHAAVATPRFAECHVLYWLSPRRACSTMARLAFVNIEDAREALREQGVPWLETMRDSRRLLALLERSDLEILQTYPTMRGIGARLSLRRQRIVELIAAGCVYCD